MTRLRSRCVARPWRPTAAIALTLALGAACVAGDAPLATGTVEYTETDVAPLAAARVLRVLVEEGQPVHAGDTLAILTQSSLTPELDTRRARVAAAEAELRDLEGGARTAEVQRARATVAAARAEAERAQREAERQRSLLASGSISAAQSEAFDAAAQVTGQRLREAEESLALLLQGARPERILAARAAVRQARAQVAATEAATTDLVLTAPHDGVVLGRHVEPGEVLAAGIPAVSLGDERRPWVRVFVSPGRLAALRVGTMASVRVEGATDREYTGTVTALASTAEFTPRVALTERERADLLFGVKLALHDSTGTIKAGLPVTVRFLDATPARSR